VNSYYYFESTEGKMEKKYKKIMIAAVILGAVVLFLVILFIISDTGLSINEINSNPEKYVNETVVIKAWFSGANNGFIYQKDFFGIQKGYLSVKIDENVDISMLLHGREYYWTGIIRPVVDENKISYVYLEVKKIETLYKDKRRHNTSKFVGTWKEIENNLFPYENETWIFYENNSLYIVDFREWSKYMVDGDKIYFNPTTPFDDPPSFSYYFLENNTKLVIDEDAERNLIRVYKKIGK